MSLFTLTKSIFFKHKAQALKAVTALRSLGVCAVLLALTACQDEFIRPNLVLIALERTRLDHVSPYGKDPAATRLYSYLARRGLLFTNAHTSAPGGDEATLDLLSGGNGESAGSLLPEILQREGYVTIGSLNERGARDPRLEVGFDERDDAGGTHEKRSDRLFRLITSHVLDEKPIFVFYQAPLIEAPYRNASERTAGGERKAPDVNFEALAERLRSGGTLQEADADQLAKLYAMEVRRAHDALVDFMAPLRGWGFFEHYLTVATALAGEELGEHGRYSPDDSLFDEVLQVPLIMTSNAMLEGEIRAELVTIQDIAPTMLGHAEITSPTEMPGRDLLGSEQSPRDAVRSRAGDMRTVRTTEWKLIERADGESVTLYNLGDDPDELTNVAAEHPEIVERLRTQ